MTSAMIYRGDFFMGVLGSVLELIAFLLFIEIVFGRFKSFAGVGRNEITLIYGVYILFETFFSSFVLKNLRLLAKIIHEGQFDHYLAKPISTLFLVSFERFDLFGLTRTLTGLIIAVYAFNNLSREMNLVITPGSITLALAGVAVVVTSFYGFLLSLFSLSFWLGDIKHAYWIYDSMTGLGKMPVAAFQNAFKVIFVFVLPFAFWGAVPVALLFNQVDGSYVLFGAIISVLWLIIGNLIWKQGIKNYSSSG